MPPVPVSSDAETIVAHLPIGLLLIDVFPDDRFRVARANDTARAIVDADGLADGTAWFDGWTAPSALAPLIENLRRCVAEAQPITFEWHQNAPASTPTYLECHMVPVYAANGQVTRVVAIVSDRTPQHRTARQMLHDALHDSLTSLPNRTLFVDLMEQFCQTTPDAADHRFGLILLNVDRLNLVNESLGRVAGDQLLVAVARRLRKCVREQDVLARLGGDEFALLMYGIGDDAEARVIADQLHASMRVPFNLGGTEVYVSISIGIATSRGDESDIESLVSRANMALTQAKSLGKGRTEIYSSSFRQRPPVLLQLETDFRRGLARGEFELHYQPIVRLDDGTIAGFEALARWNHPDHGLVSPARFIPIAENTGLIVEFGKWAIDEACRQYAAWATGLPASAPPTLSVNISGLQFRDDGLVADIQDMLAHHGVPGFGLELEITESTIMDNADMAAAVLRRLKNLDLSVAIDDFGTGYSSLSYLNHFPIDVLKIDRSFVAQMQDCEDSRKIVQIIAMLAKALDLSIVAEGVETRDQLLILRELGCDFAQGYLFARPLPVAEATRLLSTPVPFTIDD